MTASSIHSGRYSPWGLVLSATATLAILTVELVRPTASAAVRSSPTPTSAIGSLYHRPVCAVGDLVEAHKSTEKAREWRRRTKQEYLRHLNETLDWKEQTSQSTWYKSMEGVWDGFEYPKYYHDAYKGEAATPHRQPASMKRFHSDIQVFLWMAWQLERKASQHRGSRAAELASDLWQIIAELRFILCMTESYIDAATTQGPKHQYRYLTQDEMSRRAASFVENLENDGRLLIEAKVFMDGLVAYFAEARAHLLTADQKG